MKNFIYLFMFTLSLTCASEQNTEVPLLLQDAVTVTDNGSTKGLPGRTRPRPQSLDADLIMRPQGEADQERSRRVGLRSPTASIYHQRDLVTPGSMHPAFARESLITFGRVQCAELLGYCFLVVFRRTGLSYIGENEEQG